LRSEHAGRGWRLLGWFVAQLLSCAARLSTEPSRLTERRLASAGGRGQASEPRVGRYAILGEAALSHFESYADAAVKSNTTCAGVRAPRRGSSWGPASSLDQKGDCQCGSAPSVLEKRGSDPISENGKSRRSAQRAIDLALRRDTSIPLLLAERTIAVFVLARA
jgi:hypothetical protein